MWQCTGILINLLESRASKKPSPSSVLQLWSCWPKYWGSSRSALQSSPISYPARTEVFWSLHTWEKHHGGQGACEVQRVVPAELMKKPVVVVVYNSGMNGVDVNDHYRSYYPSGTSSQKWWKYLIWFFLNLSMVNGFILEKLAGKKKWPQLDFRCELAKFLIARYNGYKWPSNSGKCAVSIFTTEENLRGYFLGKLEGWRSACAMCAKARRKRKEGQGYTFETS